MYHKRKYCRLIEILTGIFLISAVLTSLLSYLFNFDYTITNNTLEDNVSFLLESINGQQISAAFWTITGVLNLILSTLFLLAFRTHRKWTAIFSSIFLLCMAFAFFSKGLYGLNIAKIVSVHAEGGGVPENLPDILILTKVRSISRLQSIGLSALGIFSVLASTMSLYLRNFSKTGSVLLFISGPVVAVFTWLDPDHILLTTGLAFSWAGLLIIGARIITHGLVDKTADKPC